MRKTLLAVACAGALLSPGVLPAKDEQAPQERVESGKTSGSSPFSWNPFARKSKAPAVAQPDTTKAAPDAKKPAAPPAQAAPAKAEPAPAAAGKAQPEEKKPKSSWNPFGRKAKEPAADKADGKEAKPAAGTTQATAAGTAQATAAVPDQTAAKAAPAAGASPSAPQGVPGAEQSPQAVLAKIAEQKAVAGAAGLTEGMRAFEQGVILYQQFKFEEALRSLERAKALLPANPDVDQYLVRARQVLGVRGDSDVSTASNWIGEGKTVQEQEFLLKMENHLHDGNTLMASAKKVWALAVAGEESGELAGGGRSEAIALLGKARAQFREALDAARWVGVGTDVRPQMERIGSGLAEVDALDVKWKAELDAERKERALRTSRDLAREQKDYEESKHKRLLTQAKADFLAGQYEKSEGLARHILKNWPTDREARLIFEKSRLRRDQGTRKFIEDRGEEEWTKNIERIQKASIPYAEELNYPKNWDRIRRRQPNAIRKVEDPEWMVILKKKMQIPVTLLLMGNSLQEAVGILQDQTDINITIDRGLFLEDARIESLRLRDVKFASALTWLLNVTPANQDTLVYTLQDGAVYITSKQRMALLTRPEQVLYDVTDLITAFQDFGLTDSLHIKSGETLSGVGEAGKANNMESSQLIQVIKENVDPASWSEEAGISINEYEIGKLLISQTPENHKAVEELLEMFRKLQTMQVSIEARFISSQEDDLLDLGVEWSGLDEIPMIDSGIPNTGAGVYSKRNNLQADTRSAIILGSAGAGIPKGQRYVAGNAGETGGLAQVAILDPIRASLALHALSEKRKLKDILAPRLTVMNNHQGYIMRAQDTSYVESYVNDQGSLRPTIQRISTGELLVVRPTISSDRKYITMDLSPQVSRNVNFTRRTLTFQVFRANAQVTSVVADDVSGDLEVPNVEVWQMQSRVQVPDGGIIFIGGRMGNRETKVSRGVPVISKIPLFGRLFRTDGEGSELDNLLISVHSKILLFDEFEAKL